MIFDNSKKVLQIKIGHDQNDLGKGSFTNYVYKKKWVDGQKNSTFIR